jgi:hypothetical protein
MRVTREKTAEELRPAFEKAAAGVGLSPLAIAPPFRVLAGPGTVEEALEALKRAS